MATKSYNITVRGLPAFVRDLLMAEAKHFGMNIQQLLRCKLARPYEPPKARKGGNDMTLSEIKKLFKQRNGHEGQ